MSSMENVRYLGIIADGSTDQEIIARLAKCLLENADPAESSLEEVMLGQSLYDYTNTFRIKASQTRDYSFCSKHALDLRNGIVTVLLAAIAEFQSKIPRELRDCDLLVLHTDAELVLSSPEKYFEEWAVVISKIFLIAIEEFYHKTSQRGWQWEHLPLVVPLVPFPSTDILVAAAKTENSGTFGFHGRKAREIKIALYGVDDLRHLREEELKQKALDFITPAACKAIYRHIPESRIFLRTLAWN